MKKNGLFTAFLIGLLAASCKAQVVSSSVAAQTISPSAKYIFYLHGGVVKSQGDNAISTSHPEWGPYEYSNILDSLRKRGYNVISERRFQEIDDSVYAIKMVKQVDSLLNGGAKTENILILGASAGWNAGLIVSAKLKNKALHYVVMGGCWPNDHESYKGWLLYGHFLSVIEKTDPHGTCYKLFETRKEISSYKEVTLNTGRSHGFIYKGDKAWIDPILAWWK